MRNKLRKAGIVFGILLVVLAALVYVAYVRSKSPVEAYKDQLRAAGEKLTVDELIPPRIPQDQNSAAIFRQAADDLKRFHGLLDTNPPGAMRMVAPGKAMIAWMQPDIQSIEGTNSWEELEFEVAARQEDFELLERIIEKPHLDFELKYQEIPVVLMPHLAPMKGAVQELTGAALSNLHQGDTESAVSNVRAMLAILKGTAKEPLLITQLVRIAIAQNAFSANWDLLQSPDLTDEQLAALQRDWAGLGFIEPMETTLQMERAWDEKALEKMRNSSSPATAILGAPGSLFPGSSSGGSSGSWFDDLAELPKEVWRGTKLKTKEALWRVSWSYTDELRALQGQQVLIETARQIRTNGFFVEALTEAKTNLDELGFANLNSDFFDGVFANDFAGLDFRWIFSSSIPSVETFLHRVMTAESARQLAITGIALKRYQLQNGSYPPSLSALVPRFLAEVPRDPVDGKPLRYRPDEKTFLLYSIGENGIDDGGDPISTNSPPSISWQRGRDWVWPQPASAQEITNYYQTLQSRRRP